jgi:hypothetical protein
MVGDVVESKRNAMARQDVSDRAAEGGPGKLDEGEHGANLNEVRGYRKRPMCDSAGAHGERYHQV